MLKNDIKRLAEAQVMLKNQRKTVRREGEKIMTPKEAVRIHRINRIYLRHMHIVYGEMRGKTREQVEGNAKTAPNIQLLMTLRTTYQKPAPDVFSSQVHTLQEA